MRRFFVFILFLFLFSGCVDSYKIPFIKKDFTDFKSLISDMVHELHYEMDNVLPKSKKLFYVSDFVNIKNLEVTSQLGFFLSSEVKSSITSQYNVNVREIEYLSYLKLNQNGLKTLSRDLDELGELDSIKTNILVGTYALTSKQLIVYLKLIDMKTGTILKSISNSIEINEEIIKLEAEGLNKNNVKPKLRPHLVL